MVTLYYRLTGWWRLRRRLRTVRRHQPTVTVRREPRNEVQAYIAIRGTR